MSRQSRHQPKDRPTPKRGAQGRRRALLWALAKHTADKPQWRGAVALFTLMVNRWSDDDGKAVLNNPSQVRMAAEGATDSSQRASSENPRAGNANVDCTLGATNGYATIRAFRCGPRDCIPMQPLAEGYVAAMVRLRIVPTDLEEIDRAAKAAGMTRSAYFRAAALKEARVDQEAQAS